MNFQIQTFLKSNFGQQAIDSLQFLSGGGSSRKYYRFEFEAKTFILTENPNIEENKTFLYFTSHFSKIMDNLPKIEAVSDDFSLYVQTDLGNQTLMDLVILDKNSSKKFYGDSIHQLVKMQIIGNENLDYSKCFSYPKFNSTLVLRDLFSFKNYFLNLAGIEFNQGKLIADFENFAQDFERIQFQGFVYRDFQSRNIMIHNEKPYFIDYQGGLKGPALYDLVSLLWQAKADLSDEWKSEFYEIYVKEFIETTKEDLNGIEFRKAYELCVLERCLQVLGTYGFRGIFEQKTHFLESIEFGLNNLKKIQNWILLENYPELKKVISKLTEQETIQKIKSKINL
jgi:aminoglycoside/choline kinase family phosphotransferase